MLKSIALAIVCVNFFASNASAADCKWFGRDAQKAIKVHVAALQRLEFEASDRLKGLDSRPFDVLLGEARKTTAIVADARAIEAEKDLERCRNLTSPIRTICAAAAEKLVEILDKHVKSQKPDYDRAAFAQAAAACEKFMDLKPLKSGLRGTE
jgi:hypothetical protein